MASAKFRQDMPPIGGYKPIDWARKVQKTGLSGYSIFGIFIAVTGFAWVVYGYEKKLKRQYRLEINDARLAIQPLMEAEQQRLFLRQLLKNRDEERELMKNVPGWEVGKWEGKRVYSKNNFPNLILQEYYAHNDVGMPIERVFEHTRH